MPVLDDTMEQHKVGGTGFHFSATKIQNLGASEYTLVGLAVDKSGSVTSFGKEIELCLQTVIESCRLSPRADNLMARVLTFNHRTEELHGFKELAYCVPGLYEGSIKPGGMTALYDTTVDLVDSMATYGKQLLSQDYSVNGIVFVITDGCDEGSTLGVKQAREAFERAMNAEALESLVSVLIGVNVTHPTVSQKLQKFKDEAGFDRYIETGASAKELAKLAGFISKSVSSQSQSLGSKSASAPLVF